MIEQHNEAFNIIEAGGSYVNVFHFGERFNKYMFRQLPFYHDLQRCDDHDLSFVFFKVSFPNEEVESDRIIYFVGYIDGVFYRVNTYIEFEHCLQLRTDDAVKRREKIADLIVSLPLFIFYE